MNQIQEMGYHYARLSRLLVDAVDTLHHIANGTVDNPQRLAKKTLKHLITDFKEIQEKAENNLTIQKS